MADKLTHVVMPHKANGIERSIAYQYADEAIGSCVVRLDELADKTSGKKVSVGTYCEIRRFIREIEKIGETFSLSDEAKDKLAYANRWIDEIVFSLFATLEALEGETEDVE